MTFPGQVIPAASQCAPSPAGIGGARGGQQSAVKVSSDHLQIHQILIKIFDRDHDRDRKPDPDRSRSDFDPEIDQRFSSQNRIPFFIFKSISD